MNLFIDEICQYLATNSNGRFTYGSGETNLKIGELANGTSGVFAVAAPSPTPDLYTAIETHQIDFFARNKSDQQAYEDMRYIYNFFHQMHHYQTSNWYVHFSYAYQADDLDRDGEGRKILRTGVTFIVMNLIS